MLKKAEKAPVDLTKPKTVRELLEMIQAIPADERGEYEGAIYEAMERILRSGVK